MWYTTVRTFDFGVQESAGGFKWCVSNERVCTFSRVILFPYSLQHGNALRQLYIFFVSIEASVVTNAWQSGRVTFFLSFKNRKIVLPSTKRHNVQWPFWLVHIVPSSSTSDGLLARGFLPSVRASNSTTALSKLPSKSRLLRIPGLQMSMTVENWIFLNFQDFQKFLKFLGFWTNFLVVCGLCIIEFYQTKMCDPRFFYPSNEEKKQRERRGFNSGALRAWREMWWQHN